MKRRRSSPKKTTSSSKKQKALSASIRQAVTSAAFRKAVGIEKKYHNFMISDEAPSESLAAHPSVLYYDNGNAARTVTALAAGSEHSQRIGNEVTMESLTFKGAVHWERSAPLSSVYIQPTIRILLVRVNKQQDFTSLPINQILDTSPALVPLPDYSATYCLRNMTTIDEYDVLYDRTEILPIEYDGDTATYRAQAGAIPININIRKGLKEKKISYTDSTASDGNQIGGICMYFLLSDNALASSLTAFKLRGIGRIRYFG